MLTVEQKADIHALFDQRDDGFAARQELAIHKEVAEAVRTAEDSRRNRLQFLTGIGGASAIGIAVLLWSNITSLVEQRVDDAISPKVVRLVELENQFEEKTRKIETLEGNVNKRLVEIDDELDKVRFALGALQTAEGYAALNRDLNRLNQMVLEMRAQFANPVVNEQAVITAPSLNDCTNPDGTFKPDC